MATYSKTYSQTIEVPQIDTTMEMELWVTASDEDTSEANSILSRMREAVKAGSPYPKEFEDSADSFSAWEAPIPDYDVSDHIKIEAMDLEQLAPLIGTLAILHSKLPSIGYKGEIWMKKRLFGAKRVTYEIVMAPGAESMEVQQRYLENQTYHHTPTVTGYFD